MKNIKAFQCSHCSFYRKTKLSVKNHEDKCFKNPKNKACASCKFNIIDIYTHYDRDHGGNPGSTDYEVSYNFCTKLEADLNSKTLRKDCSIYSHNKP